MTIKYTNIFHNKDHQNFPKLGFFGVKIYHLATLLAIGRYWNKIPGKIIYPQRL
jgi:hypothetical protein